ncbi:MAG: AarF/UbiB family protein [Tissierellales bacterium]
MLQIAETVMGKWNKNKYTVLSKLGEGGIGAVYKIKDMKGNVRALKISKDISSITREFDMMTKLKQLKNVPRAYDIDDYKKSGNLYYFFVMDYLEGYNIKEIIRYNKIKVKEIIGIGIILLNILERIYKMGYIYVDIKPDNIMVDKRGKKIRFIDFGGVIEKGRGVKEFTPAYSIFSWDVYLSSDYDTNIVFSVAMVISSMLLRREFNPLVHNIDWVISYISYLTIDNKLKKCLIKSLRGEINQISNFKAELNRLFKECNPSLVVNNNTNSKMKANKKTKSRIDVFFMFSLGLFFLVTIIGIGIFFLKG